MKSGTRRMWSRRVLRAGWMIAPLFSLPAAIGRALYRGYRAFFYDYSGKFETGLTLFVVAIASIIGLFIWAAMYQTNRVSSPADEDDIRAAMVDPCTRGELEKRLRVGMIRPWDIDRAEDECEAAAAQANQQRLLEQQRQMLGAK